MMEQKTLLLNEVDRRLLEAEATLLRQAQERVRRIVEVAEGNWQAAIKAILQTKPMRERPPVDIQPNYDPQQGALVWDVPAPPPPVEEVDPPTAETDSTVPEPQEATA